MTTFTAMPKYEVYKDSGVEWIGEIPEHWELRRLKYLAKLESGETIKPESFTDEGYPVYGGNGFRGFTNKYTNEGFFPLIGRQGALCGNVNYADGQFYASEHAVVVYSFGDIDPYWLGESIRLADFNRLSQSSAQPGISVNVVKNEWFPFPPVEERKLISEFIRRKSLQLDEAIAINEKQIELLKERKQIIIQQAVTQGLDPTVPMKDSGVEWIRTIPAHWEVKRAKYLFNEVDERSVSGDEELLSVSHITGVTPRSEKNVTMFMAEDYSGSKTCEKNDLVFNIMWAWMGALGVSDRRGIVSPSYGVFRAKTENMFNPIFLEYLLKSTNYIEHYNKVSTGLHSSRLRFYGHMFFDMELGYPSFDEQNNIIEYVQKESDAIDKALSLQEQQIDVLKEYKTTLINSAVTGKIKVV